MAARENVLSRIRAALGKSASRAERGEINAYISQHAAGPRPQAEWNLAARFRERALSLASSVDQIASIIEMPQAVARYLRENNLPLQAVCWPEFAQLDWAAQGMNVTARPAQGNDLLGITGVFCAIAETGTVVMASGPEHPVTLNLLPDTHIVVLRESDIVGGYEEVWERLRARYGKDRMPRTVNTITGPSRTGDIEQAMELGAHGPRRMHVLVVRE